ncbi:MAG: hypothetical protein LAP85_23135 [Acidobacteriia bacterium]|nr:hypothetical protein [Terriglobia bacterium]
MKCIVCNQRKGRRSCPAKQAAICPQCCGEKRILEIDCPESCEYLKIGRNHEANQEGLRHYRAADPLEQGKRARILADFEMVFVDLQTLIAAARQSMRDLTDADVAEALDCLLKTLRTEERGVLYETTTGNLRADGLRRQFSSLIESYRYPKEADHPRIHLKDAIECLDVLRAVVASHVEAGPSSLSFVEFLVRHLPRSARVGPAQPSIIIPGR